MSPLPEGEEKSSTLVASLKRLFTHSAVYGSADVFTNVTNFLLVPVYTTYLTPADYGTLGILFLFSTLAKVVFRMGLDAGFFRVYYDHPSEAARRSLTSTIALFSMVSGALLFGSVCLLSPLLTRLLLGHLFHPRLVILAASDVYAGTFAFIPLNLLRIQGRPGLFSTLSALRQGLNTVLKVVLVVRGFGVLGVLVSDVVATTVFALLLLPIALKELKPSFSCSQLGEALSFGLPKVPHGFMIQIQNFADRKILDLFGSRSQVGVYTVGYTFGTAVKFAVSAFEPAWQPFVFSQIRKQGAPALLGRVVAYAWVGFVAAGLLVSTYGPELVLLMAHRPAFWAGATIVPIVALAYVLHGAFLLTSLGIAIEKKARYYPVVTFASAATNVISNFLLIPRYGMIGAAWATVFSYTVMAAAGFWFSRGLYPIPFEWGRMGASALFALLTYGLCQLVPTPTLAGNLALLDRLPPLLPSLAAKSCVLLTFPLLLWITGFLPRRPR